MTSPQDTEVPPLARLFAIAYGQLIDTLHERLIEGGWTAVRSSYGFVLLAARDAPVNGTEIARLLGVSKQAASKTIDAMVEAGYVTRSIDPRDSRQRLIAISPRGRQFLDHVETIYRQLEDGWAATIGRERVEAIRADLTRVLAQTDGRLPQLRPTP